MPEAVPAGTVTVPLVLVRKPDGTFSQVSVTELILGFGTPLSLSLVRTLGVVPPVVLVIVVTPSFTASIVVGVVVLVVVPLTVTTMLAVLHTVGLATAHIV